MLSQPAITRNTPFTPSGAQLRDTRPKLCHANAVVPRDPSPRNKKAVPEGTAYLQTQQFLLALHSLLDNDLPAFVHIHHFVNRLVAGERDVHHVVTRTKHELNW